MIYQLRIFKDHHGRVDVHIERFRQDTCRLLDLGNSNRLTSYY
jgi:hypothetical protein